MSFVYVVKIDHEMRKFSAFFSYYGNLKFPLTYFIPSTIFIFASDFYKVDENVCYYPISRLYQGFSKIQLLVSH